MPRKVTEADVCNMVEMYQSGMSFYEIGAAIGVSYVTANRYITNSGISKRTKADVNRLSIAKGRLPAPVHTGKTIPDELVERYRAGERLRDLAAEFRVATNRVSEHLKQHGVEPDAYATRVKHHGVEAMRQKMREVAFVDAKTRQTQAVREQIANTRQERSSASGSCEVDLIGKLHELGMKVTHQLAVGRYNLDIAMDKFNIAIEIERGSWGNSRSMNPQRLEYLFSRGWRMIIVRICRNTRTFIDFDAIAQQCVAFAETSSANPSSIGQYGVIGSKGKVVTTPGSYFDTWARVPGF